MATTKQLPTQLGCLREAAITNGWELAMRLNHADAMFAACCNCNPKPATPLPPQGLFISLITLKQPQTASNTWHHHDPQQPILSRSPHTNKPQIFLPTAKPDTSTFHLYIYIYSLNATTKYFALYLNHGCHWLF